MLTDALVRLLSTCDIPDPPPASPLPLLAEWFHEAEKSGRYDDANAMSLATATPDGIPSVRLVLCKAIEKTSGTLVFYSNYQSRKGQELAVNPRAAAVFHWPHARRQARIEGSVERLTEAESDAYFQSRSLLSRIGACVSPQSTPIESRGLLVEAAITLARSAMLGHAITRPGTWGGYRMRFDTVELWSGRDGRLHQRVLWRRAASPATDRWTPVLLAP